MAKKRKRLSRKFFQTMGAKGGRNTWKNLSTEERSRILSDRAKKAWKTRRANAEIRSRERGAI